MLGRVGQALRMAGSKVRAFDDAYAGKVADYINGFNVKQGSLGDKAQNVALAMGGVPATRVLPTGDVANTMPGAGALHNLVGYGLPALNAGVRYGVPLVGLKLAADGVGALYDVASQTPVFGENPADDQSNLMVTYVR